MKDEIFRFEWTGKLVSINKWHTLARIKRRSEYKYFVGISNAYKKLKKLLVTEIKKQDFKTYCDPVDMIIKVSRWKMADTGNIEKPVGDALQEAGVLKNDRQVRHILILRDYHGKGEDDILRVILFHTYNKDSFYPGNPGLFV